MSSPGLTVIPVGLSVGSAGLVIGLCVLCAGGAAAEIRRMEAVGTEPIYSDAKRSRPPRDAAIQRALLEAVSRVADEFLLDQPVDTGEMEPEAPSSTSGLPELGPPPDPDLAAEPAADYAKIFGRDLVPYTVHYRILEDRGKLPALFAADARVEFEYVVIVEVHVDVVRVKQRLEEAGLVAAASEVLDTRQIVLEVHGLRVYPAYEALRSVLLEGVGASQVVALEFSRDSVRLGVEYARGGPAELLDALYASAPRELEITPVLSDDLQLTISIDWTPPGLHDAEGFSPRQPADVGDVDGRDPPGMVDAAAPRQPPASERASGDAGRVDTGSRNRY